MSARTAYQGKNLLRLLLAMGTPATLLYLRIVLGLVASGRPDSARPMLLVSNFVLAAFVFVQVIAARQVQLRVLQRSAGIGETLQFLGILLICGAFSVAAAVLLEAVLYGFAGHLK